MLQIIEEEAFCGNLSIGKVVVPDGTTEIRSRAFADSSLVAIELPDSLTRIADDAFEGCDQFQLVVQQGSYAYEWAVKNGYIKPSTPAEDFTYQVINDATCRIIGYTGTEAELVLPNHAPDGRAVTEIGQDAFLNCSSLTSVTIPDSVTSIGESAFIACRSLTSVTIPDGVTSIGDSAFYCCINLPSISIPSSVTSIGNLVFYGCEHLTDVEIPNGVQSIGESAFKNCYNLISVTLPDSVTSIASYAFDDCRALTSIRLPSALSTIEKYTFSNCYSLKELKLPETLTKIEDGAFEKCFSITSFDLPSNLQSIGDGVFSGCTSLVSVNLPDSLSNIGYALFEGCGEISLDVNEGSYAYEWAVMEGYIQLPTSADGFTFTNLDNEYCAITGYTGDERTLVLPKYSPDGHIVKALGDHAFYEQTSLMSVSMPDSLKEIGAYAFAGCTSLNKVMLPDGLSSIGDNAFAGCTSLIRLVLPTELSSIANKAFTNCSALESVILPDSLESIAENAFDGCGSFMVGVPDHCYAYDWAVQHGYITVSTIQDGFGYYNLDDTYCAVNGYIGEATDVVIPGLSPDGHIVQKVKDEAFYCDKRITSVVMPDSLTHIGSFAFFGCDNLTSVRFSANLESIYEAAFVATKLTDIVIPGSMRYVSGFESCPRLTSVVMNDGVEVIGKSAFHSCISLRSVTIPDSVTSIEERAFYNCSGLTNVTIPDSVTSIDGYAFENCSGLTSVTIPDSVTSIGERAFQGCSSLTNVIVSPESRWYSVIQDVLFSKDGDKLILYPAGLKATSYTIPNSVKNIGEAAFENCSSLTSVTIPDSVTSIGETAFFECSGLTSVTIPDSVTSIEWCAFCNCSSLTSVYIWGKETTIEYGSFSSCHPDLIVYGWPDSAVEAWCNDNGVQFKALKVFAKNYWYEIVDDTTCAIVGYDGNETELDLPSSAPGGLVVTRIGSSAFSNCTKLTSVTIPVSVTSIETSAFSGCSNLTSVTIPDSVTSIDDEAFSDCGDFCIIAATGSYAYDWAVKNGHINSMTPSEDFSYEIIDDTTCVLTGYNGTETELVLPNRAPDGRAVTEIGQKAFYKCSSLTSVTIPNSVTSIGYRVFAECSSLTSVTIPNSVTSIGERAFYGCSSLTSVMIPNSVTSIDYEAFYGCSSLTSVTIPNSVTSIGNRAFYECSSLTSVTIPNSVTSIGYDAFGFCSSLTSVTIPNSVTSIGDWTFDYCSSLTSVTIPNSVTSIGDYAFWGCSSLTSVTIPNSVTSIGVHAFHDCKSLKSVTIPNSVTSIGYAAFDYCSSLTSVTIPNSVTSIGDCAFFKCSSLTSVTIPNSVTSIGDDAFYGCSSLVIYGHSGSFIEGWCADHGITFAALSYTSISARVLLENGQVLSGVTVSIYEDEEHNYLSATVTTNENGTWSWSEALKGGTYWLHFAMDGYTFSSNDFSVAVGNNATTAKSIYALYGGAPTSLLSLSEDTWSVYANGGMKLVSINTSAGWYVTESPEWTSLYVQENVDNQMVARFLSRGVTYTPAQELLVSVGENTTGENRQGDIVISNGDITAVLKIAQSGANQVTGKLNSVEFLTQAPYSPNETVSLHVSASAFQQGVIVVSSETLTAPAVTYFDNPEYDFSYLVTTPGEYEVCIGVTTVSDGVQYEEYGLDLCSDYQIMSFTVLNASYDFGGMKPSDDLIDFLISYDSFHEYHYTDSNGLPTIGYGHNYSSVSEFNEPISEELARQLLWGDVASKSRLVNSQMKKYGITLTQQQFDAFVSLAYNGVSSILYRGDYRLWNYEAEYGSLSAIPPEKLMESFITWHKSSNPDEAFGLYRRRCDEAQIFLYGEYTRNYPSKPDWMIEANTTNGGRSYNVPDGWVSPLISDVSFVRLGATEVEFSRNGDSSKLLTITSSGTWSAVASDTWITLSKSTGNQNETLVYSVAANSGTSSRQGTIKVTSGTQTSTLNITQAGTQNDTMSLTLSCGAEFNAGQEIIVLATVNGGAGSYRYSYKVYSFTGTMWMQISSNSLISGSGRMNLLHIGEYTAGSYKLVVQVIDYDGATTENAAFFTVKMNPMSMLQPNTSGTVISGTYKFEWSEVEGADDYVVRIRDLTTGGMVVGDEAGDGDHQSTRTYCQPTDFSSFSQHVMRIWIGAYRNKKLIGQTQVIATAGPIQQISFASPEENALVESGNLQIVWNAFVDNMNTVALYRISVRDLTAKGQPLLIDNEIVTADTTSFILAGDAAIADGHEYRAWVGAYTQEGGRIAQKELLFTSKGDQSWEDGYVHALFIDSHIDMTIGENKQIESHIYPESAKDKRISWASDNESVARVDTSGKVTAVGYGACTITATTLDGTTITSICTIDVTHDPENTLANIRWESSNIYSEKNVGTNRLLTKADSNGYSYLRIPNDGTTEQSFIFDINNATHVSFWVSHLTPNGHTVKFMANKKMLDKWEADVSVTDTEATLNIAIPAQTSPGLYYATFIAYNENTSQSSSVCFSFAVKRNGTYTTPDNLNDWFEDYKTAMVGKYFSKGWAETQVITLRGRDGKEVTTTVSTKGCTGYGNGHETIICGDSQCSGFAKMIVCLINGYTVDYSSFKVGRMGDNKIGGDVANITYPDTSGNYSYLKLSDVDIELIEDIRPGDAVRIRTGAAHSFVVYSVTGDTLTALEANKGGNSCLIQCENTYTKSTLMKKLYTVNRYQYYSDREAHDSCIMNSIKYHNNASLMNK